MINPHLAQVATPVAEASPENDKYGFEITELYVIV